MSIDNLLPASAEQPDSQFLPGTDIQYAWDSVSLTSILSCPRRYKYQIIDGLHPRNPNYAIALVFGILFHKGLEEYHLRRAAKYGHDDAVKATVGQLLANPATATLPSEDEIEEMKDGAAGDEDDDGITLRNSKVRTRYHLIRAVVWYLDHYEDDPTQTIILPSGKPAVELSFRIPLELPGVSHPILLCGHIDRGVNFNDFLYVADYKTTKSITRQWTALFDLSHQLTGYVIAGQVIFDRPVRGALVDGAALQVGGVKFGRSFSNRTPGQTAEYFELLGYANQLAVRCFETQSYPMNTAACYFCEFKEICRQPPEFRERYIMMHFEYKRGWNPLENR